MGKTTRLDRPPLRAVALCKLGRVGGAEAVAVAYVLLLLLYDGAVAGGGGGTGVAVAMGMWLPSIMVVSWW